MKRVFASRDRAAIAIVRELPANEGIETIVQNENMSAICGEIPFVLAMPEVCVLRDEHLAQAIVERFESGEARDPDGTDSEPVLDVIADTIEPVTQIVDIFAIGSSFTAFRSHQCEQQPADEQQAPTP